MTHGHVAFQSNLQTQFNEIELKSTGVECGWSMTITWHTGAFGQTHWHGHTELLISQTPRYGQELTPRAMNQSEEPFWRTAPACLKLAGGSVQSWAARPCTSGSHCDRKRPPRLRFFCFCASASSLVIGRLCVRQRAASGSCSLFVHVSDTQNATEDHQTGGRLAMKIRS